MTHIDLPTLKALAEKAHLSSPAAEKFHDAASPVTVLGLIARVEELEAALVEIWSSVPATYDNDDPMVQRHARALNAVAALLKERGGK